MKDRAPIGEVIAAIQHQALVMNVEIGGEAKALDEGHGAGLSLGIGQAGLVDQEGGQGVVVTD